MQANLYFPDSLAIDASGNLLFVDQNQRRVRKITPAGVISTVAGNGNLAYSVDGVGALFSGFAYITGIAVDAAGNIYLSEGVANRVKKVTPVGGMVTYAGTTANGAPSGLGFAGDGQAASQAVFANPGALAVDAAGNLYIADTLNYRIRRVEASVGTITTVAGNGKCCFTGDGAKETEWSLTPTAGSGLQTRWASVTLAAMASSTGLRAAAITALRATINPPTRTRCTTIPPASPSILPAKSSSPIRITAAFANCSPMTPLAWTSSAATIRPALPEPR
jgi:sugar lactone lactonase YvrE